MGGTIGTLIYLAIVVAEIAAVWRMFMKANEPGWAAIIPIYNTIVLLKLAGRPAWWFLLLLIPIVNLVLWWIVSQDLSKAFGRGTGFGVATFFFSFVTFPILGFGSDQYQGATSAPAYAGASV